MLNNRLKSNRFEQRIGSFTIFAVYKTVREECLCQLRTNRTNLRNVSTRSVPKVQQPKERRRSGILDKKKSSTRDELRPKTAKEIPAYTINAGIIAFIWLCNNQ